MSETQQSDDGAASRELINAVREAGAATVFVTVIQTDVEYRNSCLEEVQKHVRWNDGEATAEAMKPGYGGHFFTALWEGRLGDAVGRADANNKRLLKEAFGVAMLNEVTPAHYTVEA